MLSQDQNGGRAAVDEVALLARVAAGDSGEPLAALYRRYGPRVYSLGVRLLRDRGLAEDLVQDTFVRLWRSAHRYDANLGSVQTFVFTLARRAAIDAGRRRAARPAEVPEGPNANGIQTDSIDELLLGLELRDALTGLAHKHREVLELRFDQGLALNEMAKRLDVPLGTVKTRIYYGLRALRLEFEERGILG